MAEPQVGKLIVGQSGGPTQVINASLAGVIAEAKLHDCFSGIYGLIHGIEGALKEDFLDLSSETSESLDLLSRTPASALGSCRYKLAENDSQRIVEIFRAHDIRHFVYIGGNDSMDTCSRISALAAESGHEMQVVGIPKTIDNDLAFTDHTPGFGSAALFLALATRDTGLDQKSMETHDDVTIMEAMGRNTGWLTAAAALAKVQPDGTTLVEDDAPHLIYVPEYPFDEQKFLEDIKRVHNKLGRVYVVVSEGIRDADGQLIGQDHAPDGLRDAFGHLVYSLTTGVAAYLTDLVREELNLQARFFRPGLIGRAMSCCVSETDRQEALQVGREAVRRLSLGQSGNMVTIQRTQGLKYDIRLGEVSLSEVANAEKFLPPAFLDSSGTMISQSFINYALPLIGGPLTPLAQLRGSKIPRRITPES